MVGAIVGRIVGAIVGAVVGAMVGASVGAIFGTTSFPFWAVTKVVPITMHINVKAISMIVAFFKTYYTIFSPISNTTSFIKLCHPNKMENNMAKQR